MEHDFLAVELLRSFEDGVRQHGGDAHATRGRPDAHSVDRAYAWRRGQGQQHLSDRPVIGLCPRDDRFGVPGMSVRMTPL
jgi:hypothetical protein